MTAKPETLTLPALPESGVNDMDGKLRRELDRCGLLIGNIEPDALFAGKLGLTSKEDYLAFRGYLKALIKLTSSSCELSFAFRLLPEPP